ncbi:4'-phosphopantetheinyl transferase superfamily protein [Streptomyces sp. NBC_00289]|uniref:4'-phosphopantetheinyl transferase family protein n=1 Tax=Streptomyces sp. NBC_00289 TaxID=2975703 RepID=UPI0032442438
MSVVVAPVRGNEREAARGLLLRAIARSMNIPVAGLRIDHAPGGQPILRGSEHVHVSISHGQGVVAVAFSRTCPVGVDVEMIRPLPALALARRYFDRREAEWLHGLSAHERPAAFLWLWSSKEALGKAEGNGLRGGGVGRRIPTPGTWPPPLAGPQLRVLPWEPTLMLADPLVTPGHVVATAVRAQAGCGIRVRMKVAD